jgi:adenylate kinase
MVLVLFGPPGSGKGTQGSRLGLHFGIPAISTGDMLRGAVRDGTALGRKARAYMDAGSLVPDRVMLELIEERLANRDAEHGFLLDGFPRTVPQADGLDQVIAAKGFKVDKVLNLVVARDKLITRLTARRVCDRCGFTYNVLTLPPPSDGRCRNTIDGVACHGDIVQRRDDSAETVETRLDVYDESTAPLASHYRARGVLVDIDADAPPESVFQRLITAAA